MNLGKKSKLKLLDWSSWSIENTQVNLKHGVHERTKNISGLEAGLLAGYKTHLQAVRSAKWDVTHY